MQHIEAKRPNNPGGYLERILQEKPHFDPEDTGERQQAIHSAGDVLKSIGY